MKIKLFIFIFFICFKAYGQSGWFTQNSGVTERLISLSFINSSTGWVMSSIEPTILLKTSNGGNNWNLIFFPELGRLVDIYFQDQDTGWVTGGFGVVLKTTNGGYNWNSLNIHLWMEFFYSIFFINSSTAWVVGSSGLILKTSDGLNFVRQLYGWTDVLLSVYFIDLNSGWVVGENGRMFKTTNSGENWIYVQSPYWTKLNCVRFLDENTGFVCANEGIIMKSTNSGLNWQIQNTPTTVALHSINFVNNFTGYCMGNGIILKTTNQGNNWYIQQSNVGYLWDAQFLSSDTGYACGYDGIIIKTTDGGGSIVNLKNNSSNVPDRFGLEQNYPNPFNPKTLITYKIKFPSYVRLIVYDILGNEVQRLVDQFQQTGEYEVDFMAKNGVSGVYFYRLEAEDNKSGKIFTETKKMLLLK